MSQVNYKSTMEIVEKEVQYNEVSTFDSLCMRCHKQGQTRILLTQIPFFQDIVIMSFECNECSFKNNEIQTAAPMKDKGVKYTLKIVKSEDLERMVVAGINCLIYIPEIDFEVPCLKNGVVTTIGGILRHFWEDLSMDQSERKVQMPEAYEKIEKVIQTLKKYEKAKQDLLPFHLVIDDVTGNSFISNPFAPLVDNNLKEEHYIQTKEQLYRAGYISDQEYLDDKKLQDNVNKMQENYGEFHHQSSQQSGLTDKDIHNMMQKMQGYNKKKDAHKLDSSKNVTEQEIDERLTIMNADCTLCGGIGQLTTCTCEIPFFKQICIMAFLCENCGYKDSEVKTIGHVSEKGKRITLRVNDPEDLNRDMFKSDSTTVRIKEIDFVLMAGTLGSFYSTVEGLLDKVLEGLKERNPFVGDSAEAQQKLNFEEFLVQLEDMKEGRTQFTLEFDDPLDNCFILNRYYPQEDKDVDIEEYDRTDQQNEEIGIKSFLEYNKAHPENNQ